MKKFLLHKPFRSKSSLTGTIQYLTSFHETNNFIICSLYRTRSILKIIKLSLKKKKKGKKKVHMVDTADSIYKSTWK